MGSEHIVVDTELYNALTVIRDNLSKARGSKASYADVIRLYQAQRNDLPSILGEKFTTINNLLLAYYEGDKDLAHISISLQQVLIQGLRSEAANKNIQDDLIKVVENAIAINAVNPSAKKFGVKE